MDTTFNLTSEKIVIDRIKVAPGQKIDEPTVLKLVSSIEMIGLLQPILLHRAGTGLGVKLIFGRNRLEACRRLGHTAILARVVNGDSDAVRKWCAYAQIDEQAIHRPLLRVAVSNPVLPVPRSALGSTTKY